MLEQHPPLPCNQIVYRTITRTKDFGGDRLPMAGAFLRRKSDTDGISVDYNVDVPDGCAVELSGKKAIVSLHVGWLRNLGLDVVPDSNAHAVITGVPFSSDMEQLEKVEQLAAAMAGLSRVEWVEPNFKSRLQPEE